MGHWYNDFGEPCYDAGLREARKRGLYPSVMTIDKIIANDGLEIWKQNQILEASLTLTQHDNEPDYEFIKRIKTDSREHGRKAARLGTVIHKLAERYIIDKPLFFRGQRSDVWDIFEPLKNWIDDYIYIPTHILFDKVGAEVILVNSLLGYAGKADFIGRFDNISNVILDFKTTSLKPADIKKDGTLKKAKLYPSWCRQLTALDHCTDNDNILMSVVVSTNPDFPGVWTYIWTDEEIEQAWIQFQGALMVFKSVKRL